MNSPRTTRINLLYERLKSANGIRISDLAREFEVSTKTIARDFRELQNLGAYKVGQLLYLDKKRASDDLQSDERIVLGILSKLARDNGTDFYLKAKPLLTKLTQQLDQPIYINAQSESLDSDDLMHFDFIEKLILERVELGFTYHSKSYEVKPFKLASFDGFWYVLCLDSGDSDIFKKFYFKDMENLRALGRRFTLSDEVEQRLKRAHSAWFNMNPPFLVRLLIDAQIAKYFKRKGINGAMIYTQADGTAILEMEISHIMEIKPLIYEYIPHIRVIEPQWLNDELKDEIAKFVESM